MRLQLFRSLWTNGFDLTAALADCDGGTFDGVEGPVPSDAGARYEFSAKLRAAGVPFIAEIVTGGGYVPAVSPPEKHLADFRRAVDAKDGEKIVFSWQVWPDKATLDSAEAKMHEDERLEVSGEIPFDPKRLILGCFKPLYTMGRE